MSGGLQWVQEELSAMKMTFVDGRDFFRFSNLVRTRFRFCIPEEYRAMMTAIVESAATRAITLNSGSELWRAQLGFDGVSETKLEDGGVLVEWRPHPPDRMKPKPGLPFEGRANPKGLPVLYVSTDAKTAMTEVRPNLTSIISLARGKPNRPLKVVDCEGDGIGRVFDTRPIPEEERVGVVWASINDSFARPVDPDGTPFEYLPTQIVAEYLKVAGFDGVKYRSGYGTGGSNFALFDLAAADLEPAQLHRVDSAHFDFANFS